MGGGWLSTITDLDLQPLRGVENLCEIRHIKIMLTHFVPHKCLTFAALKPYYRRRYSKKLLDVHTTGFNGLYAPEATNRGLLQFFW